MDTGKANWRFVYSADEITAMALAIGISTAVHFAKKREPVLYLAAVNTAWGSELEEALTAGFLNTEGYVNSEEILIYHFIRRRIYTFAEAVYALDKIAPGTANDDTLLYGVEVKFYNMEVKLSERLETRYPGLFVIGDCSGVTHSLSHASASGIYVARQILDKVKN